MGTLIIVIFLSPSSTTDVQLYFQFGEFIISKKILWRPLKTINYVYIGRKMKYSLSPQPD